MSHSMFYLWRESTHPPVHLGWIWYIDFFFSPELAVTVQLPILSVKKNPQNPLYTQLGVLTKGTIIEVNVSELGLVTTSGKVVWGKWAQITNTPENDGCVNA